MFNFLKKKQPIVKLYIKCGDTPLDVFIDCLVNKKFERLIREGKPTQRELENAWQKLWFEYCDQIGSPEYRQLFSLIKEAGYLEGKLIVIRLALQNVVTANDNSCVNLLHNYGYKYAFDRSKPDEFYRDIDKVATKSKTIELLLVQTKNQIDKINQKSKDEAFKSEWFDDYLTVLSKYMGYRINRKVITVSEFIRMKKMFELENERNKKLDPKAK